MSRLADHLENRQLAGRLAAAALALALSLLIGYHSYRDVVFTTDENSYLFQATGFSELTLRRAPPPPLLETVLGGGMNVIHPRLGWFSRYPPGHALWLLPGVLAGAPRLMSGLAAALSVWWLTAAARRLRAPWWAAALFLLLSPFFLFMHGTLLTHTSSMCAISLMLWAYLSWRESRQIRHLGIAGGAWAFLYLIRPYTAALIVPAFAAESLLQLVRQPNRRTWWALVAFAAAAGAGPLLTLGYNHAMTGDGFQTPYLMYFQNAQLGFNETHSPAEGLSHLQLNLQLLGEWLFGAPWILWALGLAVAVAVITIPLAWFAALAAVSIIGGYILFYYPGYNTCGPYYYFEILPFLTLLWCLVVRRAAAWRGAGRTGLVLLAVVASSSLPFAWRQAQDFRQSTRPHAVWKATLRTAPPNSVVAILEEGFRPKSDDRTLLRPNLRGMDSDPLVLFSMEDQEAILADHFPGRNLFRFRITQPQRLEPYVVSREPYAVRIYASSTHAQTGRGNGSTNEATWCRQATSNDPPGMLAFGPQCVVPSGRCQAVFDLTVSHVPPDKPVLLNINVNDEIHPLVSREVSGNPGRTRIEVPFHLSAPARIEPIVLYAGEGDVAFWSVSMKVIPPDPAPESGVNP